jgi:hypothetical protein
VQSYVVRVYRRNLNNKDEVAGIIEKVGTQHQNSFLSLSESAIFRALDQVRLFRNKIDCTAMMGFL